MKAFEKLESFWPPVRWRAARQIGDAAAEGLIDEDSAVDTLIAMAECSPRSSNHRFGLRDQLAAIEALGQTKSSRALNYLLGITQYKEIEIGKWRETNNRLHELEPGMLFSEFTCVSRLKHPSAKGPLANALISEKEMRTSVFQTTTMRNGPFLKRKPSQVPDLVVSSFKETPVLRIILNAIGKLALQGAKPNEPAPL